MTWHGVVLGIDYIACGDGGGGGGGGGGDGGGGGGVELRNA